MSPIVGVAIRAWTIDSVEQLDAQTQGLAFFAFPGIEFVLSVSILENQIVARTLTG
jgi:hypothetical protein